MTPAREIVVPTDHRAFDQLARDQRPELEAVARRVVGCSEIAAEIVQDVFYRLWRDRERLVVEGPLPPYLRRAVRNRALDHLKRRRVESEWRARELVLLAGVAAPASEAPVDWDQAVVHALGELPTKRRQAILLRWCHDFTYQEIADRLGVSVKTVENQIGRGLKTLRLALGAR